MKNLKLADNLVLPVDFCTQTMVVFGKRGSGKSSTGTRFAEQLAGVGVPFAVLDPPDAWWGIKSSKDGKSEGIQAYIFGGRHADLPLDASNGALLADVLVDHRVNVVMSLRHFSNLERSRFVIEFAERLFQRNTEPLHLFCEEAHRLMPLDMREYGRNSRAEEMTGRMVKLITEGRTSGIGISSITQRPAMLNSTARNQSEILVAHRIIGPHDRGAIEDWIKYHREDDKKAEVLASLGELKTGDAWVWAPDFPEEKPIGLRRVHFYLPETFDSRRTPKAGERLEEPKALAPVDLEKLRDKMAATIERAKAEDPRELKKRIAELEKQVSNPPKIVHMVHPPPVQQVKKVIEKVVPDIRLIKKLEAELIRFKKRLDQILPMTISIQSGVKGSEEKFTKTVTTSSVDLDPVFAMLTAARGSQARTSGSDTSGGSFETPGFDRHPAATAVSREPLRPSVGLQPQANTHAASSMNGDLRGPEQRVLDSLSELESLGIYVADRAQVALLANYTHVRSKGFTNAIGALNTAGRICYPGTNALQLTETGRKLAREFDRPPTSNELQERVIRRLGGPCERILRPLIAAYPEAIEREQLARRAMYNHVRSKGFTNALGRLRSLGLIEYAQQGHVRARSVLWLN